jgi:hypothetical protein
LGVKFIFQLKLLEVDILFQPGDVFSASTPQPHQNTFTFFLSARELLFFPLPDKLFHFPLKISPGRPSRDGSLRSSSSSSSSVSYTSIYIFLCVAPELLAPLVCVPSREKEPRVLLFPFFAMARSLFACLRDKVQLHSPPPPSGPFLLSFANADVTTHTPTMSATGNKIGHGGALCWKNYPSLARSKIPKKIRSIMLILISLFNWILLKAEKLTLEDVELSYYLTSSKRQCEWHCDCATKDKGGGVTILRESS